MSEWVGRTLSKVQIERLLGRGGMAEVYLGRHQTLGRMVAVKLLHAHLTDDPSLLQRFTGEAQAVAAMRHPNIVQVYDYDVADNRPYIIMELLDGISLKDYLSGLKAQGLRLLPVDIVRIVNAIGAALDYAHSRGIVHRDIKPANVMLRREKGAIKIQSALAADVEPVLTDFGVARIADGVQHTASGVIIGTPAYMSPEQVNGQVADPRSDIYALGIMLYEMLSGKLPFEGDTQASVMIKHITEPPPPLDNAVPAVQHVVDRALAKDPAQRFQRASDLARALQGALGVSESTVPASDPASTLADSPLSDVLPGSDTVQLAGQTALPDQTAVSPPGTRLSLPVIGGGLGVVAAVIIGILAATGAFSNREAPATEEPPVVMLSATETPPEATEETLPGDTPAPTTNLTTPRGQVVLRDASVAVTLTDIDPASEGHQYEAWLTSGTAAPLSLGVLTLNGRQGAIAFTDPAGQVLLKTYSGFVISVEPTGDTDRAISEQIAYRGDVPAETAERLAVLYEYTFQRGVLKTLLTEGARFDAQQYNDHLGWMIDAINVNNMADSKMHGEHVINIVQGRDGADFGDWNGNGLADNPGDDVGLLTYVLLIQDGMDGAAQAPGADVETVALAQNVSNQVDQIAPLLEDASRQARAVATADSLDSVRGLAAQIETMGISAQMNQLLTSITDANLAITIDVLPVQ